MCIELSTPQAQPPHDASSLPSVAPTTASAVAACRTLVTRVVIGCCLVIGSAGCWGSSDTSVTPELEPKELKTEKDPLSTDAPEADLSRLSKKLYQVGMFTVARDSFSSLKDRYPLGAYATFAEIKLADTYFYNREYNEAAKAYDNFVKNYPGSSEVPYAKLQAARSHVASARGTGRDRQPLERGLTLYDELVTEYPQSAYQVLARSERIPVITLLAAYDQEIINYYVKTGNEAAVKDRQSRYQQRWGARLDEIASVTPAAQESTTEPPLAALTKLPEPAPLPNRPMLIETLGGQQTSVENTIIEGRSILQSLKCHTDGIGFAMIEVTEIPSGLTETAVTPQRLTPSEGRIVVHGANIGARQTRYSCFATDDLEILPNGDISIVSATPLVLTALDNPPRLLLSAE